MLLDIKNLHFGYSKEKILFNNFNLRISEGKIIALAGESGCGKSTLLSIIYGLLDWQSGEIIFDETKLLGPKGNLVPGEKQMKMVAQHYDLMPYATVAENIGKYISNINLQDKKNRVSELMHIVGMEDFANQKPKFLSGGQQQRVAIARALSVLPKLLLLDEPFSSLDFSRKIELRESLFHFVKKNNISLLISTHEIQEVMPWLDQIIVLKDGRLIQNDSPKETYINPYNDYVAQLFGEVNVLTDTQRDILHISSNYWYPHEIVQSDQGLSAQILESRFAGNCFWNKIEVSGIPLIMYSPKELSGYISIRFDKTTA